ncbi:MAG: ATP-binding cassette domain-containing protein [Lachnospiraceae bacterium]|nr:ATP-binding cassette domain-containing protein [Lachnospiraceae bacterium]
MALTVDIEKKIGQFHLKSEFQVKPHEVFGLLGESGCGKTMTLKCIAGIETPDRGRILLNGRTLFDSEKKMNLSPQKRRIGYLFQDYALFPNMTVLENIALVLKDKKQAFEYLEKFYLKGLEHHYPSMLSGGQKQRCAIARMMASKPEMLLFDEPFSAVDQGLKWNLELQIMEILDGTDIPAIFVSHNREEIYHLCHKVGIMQQGSMVEAGKKEEVFHMPKTAAAAKIVGCENIFFIRGESYTHIGILQEAIKIVENGEAGQITGRIEKIFPEQDQTMLIIRMEKKALYVRVDKKTGSQWKEGEIIQLYVDPSKIWYLS